MLWVREMNDFEGKPLPGTEDAQAPFFSPDGEQIGFFGVGLGTSKLLATPAAGGMVRTVVSDSVTSFGGAWGRDGNIYFTVAGGGIGRVKGDGGAVSRMSTPDTAKGEEEHDYVQLLPNGKGAIVQIWRGSPGQNEIGALSFATGKVTRIVKGTYARFLPPDKLLYGTTDGRVFSVTFSESKLAAGGAPAQVLDRVQGETRNGTLQFAVSESGTLVYLPGSVARREVVWVARDGTETLVDSTWTGNFEDVSLSPDGSRLAMTIHGDDGGAIWVKRLPSGSLTRLTFAGASDRPAWSPDGQSVAYLGMRKGTRTAWTRRADGSNEEQPLNRNAPQLDEIAYSPDGRVLIE